MVGRPVKFVPSEKDPLRIFGLPKSLLLEVSEHDHVLGRLSYGHFFFHSFDFYQNLTTSSGKSPTKRWTNWKTRPKHQV
jgi:hypothetical protein